MPISFIYFDIGGVLLSYKIALKKIAKKYNLDFEKFSQIFKANQDDVDRGILSPDNLVKKFQAELDFPNMSGEDFVLEFVGNFKPRFKTHNLLRELNQKYKIGILSNVSKPFYDLMWEMRLIPRLDYQAIIQSWQYQIIKPEEKIYQIATDLADTPREQIFFLDDTLKNIKAAQKFGWQAMHFDDTQVDLSMQKIKNFFKNNV